MFHNARQKKRQNGARISILAGLAADVGKVIHRIDATAVVTCIGVRGCKGEQRVKLSWGDGKPMIVTVFDKDRGERELRVEVRKYGAVARILKKNLVASGLYAARSKEEKRIAA